MSEHDYATTSTAHTPPLNPVDIDVAAARGHLRNQTPLIQCITNTVVQQFAANVLLTIGASPAMLDHEADAGQFATVASGVNVNFGTATSHQYLAADAAIEVANELHRPWVLDPVAVGGVDYRTTRIRAAAARRPSAVRGNASEVATLAGLAATARGVDSTDTVDAVLPAAITLAQSTGGVVAISGPVDAVVACRGDRTLIARISGGSEFMPLVIGTGCSLGAATTAYLAAGRTGEDTLACDFASAIAAHAHFAAAGTKAAQSANGPGSFAVAFLDALWTVSDAELNAVSIELTSTSTDEHAQVAL